MQAKDNMIHECRAQIHQRDSSIQKFIKLNGSLVKNPKEEPYTAAIEQNYKQAKLLQDEKCHLADRAAALLDRHIKRLDIKIRSLQDDGSMPIDPQLPSLLRDSPGNLVPPSSSINTGTNTPLHPLSGNTVGGTGNLTHQAIARISNATRVAPPIAAQHLLQHSQPNQASAMARSTRETSASSEGNKRRKLNASLGALPSHPSHLARQSSIGPGTPKPQTPSASRAGSAGPRTTGKKIGIRKSIGQQGGLRKKVASGRLKNKRPRQPGRASPSTTADDESAMSGDQTEDENGSTGGNPEDQEAENDFEEEAEDNTKYCFCQRTSHGNMIACDNPECRYMWFHWECVGLKEEPQGEWFCSECKPLIEQNKQQKHKQKKTR
jgi:inhibitor of growth protein 3